MNNDRETKHKVRNTHFPIGFFVKILGSLLLIAGIHMGIIQLYEQVPLGSILETGIIMCYWILISIAFTFYTRSQMKKTYENPMKEMAAATAAVAHGDFSVYLSPLHTTENLDYLDVMIMDFNKMVEELGSIETLKTDFFSNVSHEIKTPIAVIQNSAEILERTKLTEEARLEYVRTILQSARKLSALISNILKINKLEKQNIQPEAVEYDLCSQLCECALQFEDIWEEKKINFEVDIEDRAIIDADPSLLELVWTNIFSNAIKFTPAGGTVTLRETSEKGEIHVSISDTGCGMTKETIRHVFDKFYQGDTSHFTEGNGLGLTLAFRIIQMSGGGIRAESELGKGTTFYVNLQRDHSVRTLN